MPSGPTRTAGPRSAPAGMARCPTIVRPSAAYSTERVVTVVVMSWTVVIVDSASRRCSSSAQQCGRRSLARIQVIDGSRPDSGYVFTSPRGEPVNLNTDHGHWNRLLTDAGLRDGRLHDARHTAATVLLILGVPERAVMGSWGGRRRRWRRGTSTSRVWFRSDVAQRVGGLIWGAGDGK